MPRPRKFNEFDVIEAAIRYFGANNFLHGSMRKLAPQANVSCGSLYNAFGDKRSLFRTALLQSVDRSFRPEIGGDQVRLSPFSMIELFFAEAIDTCTYLARNDGRLLLRAGFEAGNIDMECAAIVSESIEALEKYLTDRVSAVQIDGDIICTQSATELAGLLLTTFLNLIIVVRLWPRPCENSRRSRQSKNSTLQIALYWLGGDSGRVKRRPKTS